MSRLSAVMQKATASQEPSFQVRNPGGERPSLEATSEFINEEQFRATLCRERKRSERSRKQILLMLVSNGENSTRAENSPLLSQAFKALNSVIRDTDIAGWFETNTVLGVLFTELGDSDASVAAKAIQEKATKLMEESVTVYRSTRIKFSFYAFPDEWSENGKSADSVLYPDLLETREKRKIPLLMKRCMDVLGSGLALLVLSPVFFALTVLIKLTSKGPVFYRQERVGQYGARFTFLKFRSMHVSGDENIHKEYVQNFIAGRGEANATADGSKKIFKLTNDPRVTWLGKIMRRTSLDELPQFWNVLCGDMSLVGPRPPIPYELEAYDLWHRRRLLEVMPGITGLWQVSGRNETTFDEMVRLDLQYSRSWSPILDVKILLQTPRAVFSGDGAC